MHASTADTTHDDASRSGRANLLTGVIRHISEGGAVTEIPYMSPEIARKTRARWMCIRCSSRELYDQPKVALSFKPRRNGKGRDNRGVFLYISLQPHAVDP